MKITSLFTLVLFAQSLFATETVYRVSESGKPIKENSLDPASSIDSLSIEKLDLRVVIKRFTIRKTENGTKIDWDLVCEENSGINVKDLVGGGLISEELMLACRSEIRGHDVTVAVSGMVYESEWAGFSDEAPKRLRNFFSHLSVSSNGGPIIFGPGDFNLGYTRELPFTHWVSELSTDNAGGRLFSDNADLMVGQKRQGFVASVRYGKESR